MEATTTALASAVSPLRVLEPDAHVQGIPEAVVQEIWAKGEFNQEELKTVVGEAVTILNAGTQNLNGGPDFTAARIQIDGESSPGGRLDWTGDVEIHRTSGEWLLHRHHEDPKYDRVVLHVVLLEDRHTGALRRADGTLLPEIVLYPRLTASLRSLLHRFYTREQKDFYCEAHWQDVSAEIRNNWLARLGLARVRMKATMLAQESSGIDFDELTYRAVVRALGYSKNADAMSELARRLPLELLRSQPDMLSVEALLFGVSGLLPDLPEMMHTDRHSIDYVESLRECFERQQQSAQLRPMSSVSWQYFRLRPANFPTRRLAQAAALLDPGSRDSSGGLLHSETLQSLREALQSDKPKSTMRLLLQEVQPSAFWNEHVRFENRTGACSPRIGKNRADRILMDAVLPLLLLDAEQRRDKIQEQQVGRVLSQLSSGSDELTRKFEDYGPILEGALGTQGLHQLYRKWCSKGRCLSCEIGQAILSQNSTERNKTVDSW